jgi:UDP-N-acetylmuramoylalanine--D-glutamate ligase
MTLSELQQYKNILILGYGKEGKSTEAYLKKHLPLAHIFISDQADGEHYLAKQKEADLVVRSPGIRLELMSQKWTTATNIFFHNFPGKTVGVTGTKGKSTTASLTAALLAEHIDDVRLVGNIGKPMLDILDTATTDTVAVIELSSYQLVDLYMSPQISLVVNWFPEHKDFHGSFDAYKRAKQNAVFFQQENDTFVYDPHDKEVSQWTALTKAQQVLYTDDFPFDQTKIKLLGEHNRRNIQGALTVARLFGVTDAEAMRALYSFQPLPHRLQNIGTVNGITFYDDAISTTPESTIAALESLGRVDTILLGGQDRGYDFNQLVSVLAEKGVGSIVLFPETGGRIKHDLAKLESYTPAILQTESMKDAVTFAFTNSRPGGICLLSTASPSYSLWKNFEEKGDLFQKYVHALTPTV